MMQRRHYKLIAEVLNSASKEGLVSSSAIATLIQLFHERLKSDNENFSIERFSKECYKK